MKKRYYSGIAILILVSFFHSVSGQNITQIVRGKVIDETKKTLVIKNTKIQRIAKQNAVLEIKINNRKITVEGINLIGKPENRIKKQNKRKW